VACNKLWNAFLHLYQYDVCDVVYICRCPFSWSTASYLPSIAAAAAAGDVTDSLLEQGAYNPVFDTAVVAPRTTKKLF